ncbi:MAG: hypothetical protein IID36_05645 [Planctomycetes bacterium]|nr:hypothetical protein [Planctomycetota bacterium]
MDASAKRKTSHIKKYPNRRYYDTSQSAHVTLQQLHDSVAAGNIIVVTDSRTGEDITNLVLMQILLEKEQPKLLLFPASLLHQMVRSDSSVLRTFVDRFFGPFQDVFAMTKNQFDAFVGQAMGRSAASPFDWAERMMKAFATSAARPDDGSGPGDSQSHPDAGPGSVDETAAPPRQPETSADAPARPTMPQSTGDQGALAELREQLSLLTRRIDEISSRETP